RAHTGGNSLMRCAPSPIACESLTPSGRRLCRDAPRSCGSRRDRRAGELPQRLCADPHPGDRTTGLALWPLPPIASRRTAMPALLIVEDETVLARTLARAFATHGWTVHHASTAEEARRVAGSLPADVVLLDLRLPDGSGLDVLGDIATSAPELPVVM